MLDVRFTTKLQHQPLHTLFFTLFGKTIQVDYKTASEFCFFFLFSLLEGEPSEFYTELLVLVFVTVPCVSLVLPPPKPGLLVWRVVCGEHLVSAIIPQAISDFFTCSCSFCHLKC